MRARTQRGGGVRLSIGCRAVLDDLTAGASLAVDGVCQTVVACRPDGVEVDAVGATLQKTTLGALHVGERVNLERALAVGGRLNGHFVQGHVNGTGTVRNWERNGQGGWRLELELPGHLRRYVVREGSLAVNGVSLTVAELEGERVGFSIIPYTAEHTALRDRTPGAAVNLEVDMIAKYVEILQAPWQAQPQDGNGARTRAAPRGLAAAVAELAAGGMIIVTDHAAREDEGDLVIAAEHVSSSAVNFMVTHGRGLVCVPLTAERAAELELEPMTAVNSALHHTAFTVSVDYRHGTTTGTSAGDRAATIAALADPAATGADFARPGHVFPIVADPGGVRARAGHTEAAIELARLARCRPVAVICEIMAADGSMARGPELQALANRYALPLVSVEEVAQHGHEEESA